MVEDDIFDVEFEPATSEEAVIKAFKNKSIKRHEEQRALVKKTGEKTKDYKILPKTPEIVEVIDALAVEEKKNYTESLAWNALETKLNKDNPPDELIKMVLGKHFPKINVNMNMKLNNLDHEGLIEFIENA